MTVWYDGHVAKYQVLSYEGICLSGLSPGSDHRFTNWSGSNLQNHQS